MLHTPDQNHTTPAEPRTQKPSDPTRRQTNHINSIGAAKASILPSEKVNHLRPSSCLHEWQTETPPDRYFYYQHASHDNTNSSFARSEFSTACRRITSIQTASEIQTYNYCFGLPCNQHVQGRHYVQLRLQTVLRNQAVQQSGLRRGRDNQRAALRILRQGGAGQRARKSAQKIGP
jgi:hypothetical protein